MFTKENHIRKVLLILIVVSTIIRIILALTLELTNDEPNYWLYAKFPAISHYEHPPMIGFIIQLTTLNLTFENEFFLRISSLILGIFNTYLVFAIGRKIKDELTGLYAAFLYTTSFYSFIIAGVFIHPDTPLLFFSLIGLYLLIDGFSNSDIKINTSIMLAGLAIGLAMLSKYTALHLWLGAFLFVIFFKRNWLTRKEIYISALTSVLCIMPVVIWNAVNKSNTLTFWAQNVPAIQTKFSFNFFLPELGGQIFYNNPVNFFIIIFSIIGIKKFHLPNNLKSFLLLTGIPLPLMLLLISLTSRTLPHWSAPGYIPLIIFAAAYLSERHKNKSLIPVSVKISMVFSILIIALATAQINYGIFGSPNPDEVKATELGRKDITLDMYGWRQAGEKFAIINDSLASLGMISKNAPIFSNKWYNAGKVDYYIARKLGKFVFTIGSDVEIRKYDWVNRERGGYQNVTEAYYISPSRDYQDPKEKYGTLFSSIIPVDTIRVERCGHIVENMFVYVMKK